MLSIQTNVNSLVAQQNLSVNSAFQSKTIAQLTSGYRINQSGDDAAGLAVANKFRNSVAELTQGVANGNDATAQLQIMDGGISNIGQMLDRLKTLAMQSSSATFSGGDTGRAQLNSEFQTDIAEIDRQAQSIGLNAGGTFAKSLAVYLGAGSGSQNVGNSVVNIDLSKSVVDTNALGLSTFQAANSNTYDLSATSATSVAKILADASNQAQAGNSQVVSFSFFGQGFANPTGALGNNTGIVIKADLSGVTDAAGAVNAINTAIQKEAGSTNAGDAAFKTAGITASVITDSSGNQKLAFGSNNAAFQVAAGNQTANALMGNFNVSGDTVSGNVTTAASGQSADATAASTSMPSISASSQWDLTGSNNIALQFANGGTSAATTITLSGKYSSAAQVAADLQGQLNTNAGTKNAGISVSIVNGQLVIDSKDGGTALTVKEGDGGTPTFGFGTPANTAAGVATATAATVVTTGSFASFASSGAHQLGTAAGTATSALNFDFAGMGAADTQNLTIAATDTAGASHSLVLTLAGSAAGTAGANQDSGTTLTKTVAYLNQQLQASGDSTLQKLTAVVSNADGNQGINFVSNLNSYSVTVGANSTANKGVMVATGTSSADTSTGKSTSVQVGSGGSVDISTISGAQAAVTAISAAVTALGTAQAAIGKGQNELGYAVSLATSQITNFSAAESQIRDTNVAQQAANLSKAQVLSQASIAAMAQANSAPQAVLSLLRG